MAWGLWHGMLLSLHDKKQDERIANLPGTAGGTTSNPAAGVHPSFWVAILCSGSPLLRAPYATHSKRTSHELRLAVVRPTRASGGRRLVLRSSIRSMFILWRWMTGIEIGLMTDFSRFRPAGFDDDNTTLLMFCRYPYRGKFLG